MGDELKFGQGDRGPSSSVGAGELAPDLQWILECAPAGMMVVDRSGRIRFANPRAEEIFGYDAGELAGRAVEDLVPARLRDRHRDERGGFDAAPRVRPMGSGPKLTGIRKAGEEIPVEIGLSPIVTGGERLILTTVADMSERRRTDEAERLFFAATTHDVRNALTAVLGHVDLLSNRAGDDQARESLRRIESIVRGLSAVVTDLLSEAVHTGSEAEVRPVSIRRLLGACVLDAEIQCDSKGLSLDVDLPEERRVATDPALLSRIVQNLLVNAVRYTVRGGIRVRAWLTDAELHVIVQDTGIGIPAEAVPRLFDKYYRHPGAQEIERLGTGLGLATVKQFCDVLGGSVSVESTPGVGSTFAVVIPVTICA